MSMATTTINIDDRLKKEAQELFKSMGLNLSSAINIFLNQAVKERAIPFTISDEVPNRDTIMAFLEGEALKQQVRESGAKAVPGAFESAEAMFDDLGI